MNIPLSLKQVVRPTLRDAQYVPMSPIPGYQVITQIPYREQVDFATREQCEDLITMIKELSPEADLKIVDTGENRVYPPYVQFKYFNAGGRFDPRIFEIVGTITVPEGTFQTIIEVGYFIQVHYLMENRNATGMKLVVELGGVFPHWV